MKDIEFIGISGNDGLIANVKNILERDKKNQMSVNVIKVNLYNKEIFPLNAFQLYLKFGIWHEPTQEEKKVYMERLLNTFSEKEIQEKIFTPLLTDPNVE